MSRKSGRKGTACSRLISAAQAPRLEQAFELVRDLDAMADEVYRYLNFNEISD